MKIAVIGATDKEILPLMGELKNAVAAELCQRTICTGRLFGTDVVAAVCGVGKVNAALTAQLLIDTYHPDCVINTGVAGGLSDELRVGDVVIGVEVAHHDIPMSLISNEQFLLPEFCFPASETLLSLCRGMGDNLRFGRIVTGEKFITAAEREAIIEEWSPLCVDMESAAIAQVCSFNNLSFLAIRALSDMADREPGEQYDRDAPVGALTALEVVRRLIKALAEAMENAIR